jgi:hypothetical protein
MLLSAKRGAIIHDYGVDATFYIVKTGLVLALKSFSSIIEVHARSSVVFLTGAGCMLGPQRRGRLQATAWDW